MLPASGGCAPASTLISVLLPAPFSPTSASTSPARKSRSTPRSARTPGNDLTIPCIDNSGGIANFPKRMNHRYTETQRRKTRKRENSKSFLAFCSFFILSLCFSSLCLCVSVVHSFFSVQLRRNQNLRWHFLALEVARDDAGRFAANAIRILHRIGVDLALFDCLLALWLAIEADNFYLIVLVGLLQCGTSAQRRRIVDGEDACQIRIALHEIFGRLVSLVLNAAAGQFRDDFHCTAPAIVSLDHFLEAGDAQQARFRRWIVENGDLAAAVAERFEESMSGLLTAGVVIGSNVRDDIFCLRSQAGNVAGEHGDARVVSLLNGRP